MLATAPALFPVEIAGQMDLFDQEETTMTETPAPRKASTRRGPNPHHRTFVATLHNGGTATRSSKTRNYSHAVELIRADGTSGIYSWHHSPAAATKQENWCNQRIRGEFRVVPVTAHQYNSAAARIARATEKAEQAS